ncbi:hypothetical protein SNE40_023433 [Patella caerulea]|uniref:EF-hand domain-containing protein n=1 Tax=Patella caerulea TaxID=87958 RepID=A0AAN8J0D2_PATCE
MGEKEQRFNEFFDTMDASGNGVLTIKELHDGLTKKCGFEGDVDAVAEMFCGVDSNSDSQITRDEFIDNCLNKLPRKEAIKTNLNLVFNKIDVDGSGVLEADEVRELFKNLGFDLSDDEIESYISQADNSGDGKISLKELNTLLKE